MKKNLLLFLLIAFAGCSTRIQYVGASYPANSKPDVYVTESAVKKSYTIMGQGYIKAGGLYSNEINWNKIRKKSVKTAREKGADAVMIVQKRAVSPIPAINTNSGVDSVGKGVIGNSRTETYYPVSTWHDILFLKYNQ